MSSSTQRSLEVKPTEWKFSEYITNIKYNISLYTGEYILFFILPKILDDYFGLNNIQAEKLFTYFNSGWSK